MGECMMGHSTSMLLQALSNAYETIITAEDEIVAMEMAHESNYGPWTRLAEKTGARLKEWRADPKNVCHAQLIIYKRLFTVEVAVARRYYYVDL